MEQNWFAYDVGRAVRLLIANCLDYGIALATLVVAEFAERMDFVRPAIAGPLSRLAIAFESMAQSRCYAQFSGRKPFAVALD